MIQLDLFDNNGAALSAKGAKKMAKIKTSKKAYTWTVQKKEGGRWRSIVDSNGVVLFQTRSLARNVSREYNNTARIRRSFRVKKLA
jgi:hypothetical protein